jgi:hypothetical protein
MFFTYDFNDPSEPPIFKKGKKLIYIILKVPMNYICLIIFTFSMSTCLAAADAAIFNNYKQNGEILVLISSIIYTGVLLSLFINIYIIRRKFAFSRSCINIKLYYKNNKYIRGIHRCFNYTYCPNSNFMGDFSKIYFIYTLLLIFDFTKFKI